MEVEQEGNLPEPTKELSKSIKAIGKDTVHKICSGQVVLNLAIATKELVENSIDAGATLVEVKLKEQGLESVEVSDNGSGVEECNLAGMTAKYHTSKLREFSDLESVLTFGFRGEALSSLCALSDMTITTRHVTSEIGVKLELDHNGKIKNQSPCARQIGTTVTLCNLFSTLPVRKREFTKNIKKEFTKMCQILQAYCLVSKGVRIICTNQNEKGVKTTVLSTHGSKTNLENIQAVFGSRQCQDLVEMKQPIGEDDTNESILDFEDPNSSLDNTGDIDLQSLARFKIEGWISSCNHGSGRSSKDRQYFFINTRPCEPKNIMKIVNEMYHRYNVHQYPFVFLNIIIATSDVDVNLTPDKRQLLVNNEKILLLAIKRSLLKTFGNIPSTFKLQNSIRIIDSVQKKTNRNSTTIDDSDDETPIKSSQQKFMDVLSQWKATGDTNDSVHCSTKSMKRKSADDIMAKTLKMKKIQEYLSQKSGSGSKSDKERYAHYKSDAESDDGASEMSFSVTKIERESKEFDAITQRETRETMSKEQHRYESIAEESSLPSDILTPPSAEEDTCPEFKHRIDCKVKQRSSSPKLRTEKLPPPQYAELSSPISQPTNSEDLSDVELMILDDETDDDETMINQSSFARDSSETISTSIEEIEKMVKHELNLKEMTLSRARISRLKFKTEINPSKNRNAEEELQREITKDMFCKMDIIGQFNLGFIIVRLDNDLFIVDQHATDEKYNFEDLQKRTVLQNQKLAVPQSLELTTVNEMILMDNLEIFEANGFKFQINEDAPVTKKVKLLAKPFSKNWVFGKEDIDELIFMLQDAPPNTMCRPSRIRAMFASRSCRKSVMIGKPLKQSVMRRLIDHMGEIEQPWNCPHGRPTMRHLVNLAMLQEQIDDK